MLLLVKAFLKAGILTELGERRSSDTGTPLGGILSPLLANIALSVLDEHFTAMWEPGGRMQTSGKHAYLRSKGLPTSASGYARPGCSARWERSETASTTRWPSPSSVRGSSNLLDRRSWPTRHDLANAIFEYIEAWYNPRRRHSTLEMLSPVQYEQTHAGLAPA